MMLAIIANTSWIVHTLPEPPSPCKIDRMGMHTFTHTTSEFARVSLYLALSDTFRAESISFEVRTDRVAVTIFCHTNPTTVLGSDFAAGAGLSDGLLSRPSGIASLGSFESATRGIPAGADLPEGQQQGLFT
jgi:hypothetical protein